MAEGTVDNLQIEITASADKAVKSLEKIKDALGGFKKEMSGIDTKKFKSAMSNFDTFQKKLQNIGKNTFASNSFVGLKEQIAQAEKRLDSLLAKEEKAKVVGGVDENSKSWRNLQYDIAEVCNKLDVFYNKMDQLKLEEPEIKIKFWDDNLEDVEPIDDTDIAQANTYTAAIDDVNNSLTDMAAKASNAGATNKNLQDTVSSMSDKMSELGQQISKGVNVESFNEQMQDVIDKINTLQHTMSGMENATIPFDDAKYKDAARSLAQLQQQFDKYKSEVMKDTPQNLNGVAEAFNKIGAAVKNVGLSGFGNILQRIATTLPLIGLGGAEASAGFQAMATGLTAIQTALPIIGLILAAITAIVNKVRDLSDKIKQGVQNAVNTLKNAVTKIKEIITKIKAGISSFFDGVKEKLGLQGKSLDNIGKKLKSFMRLFTFMALRKALTALFSQVSNSFNLLAQYSDMMGTRFNRSVSLIVADAKWLGGSIVAAFEPIINAVVPIIDALISKLVAAINVINQFFSALTGGATWTRAKKNITNYASGLDSTTGSAKAAKKAIDDLTTGIDELNILRQDDDTDTGSGGGSGAGGGAGDWYTTESIPQNIQDFVQKFKEGWERADLSEVGNILATKLAQTLANIPWDGIKSEAEKMGERIATLLNGFFETKFDGHSIAWWIGWTVGNAIDTAFIGIKRYVDELDWTTMGQSFTDLLKGAMEAFNWDTINQTCIGIGTGIADFLNAVFMDRDFWEEAGDSFANAVNSIIDMGLYFVNNFNFNQFGESVGTFLGNALRNIDFVGIGLIFSTGLNGAFEALHGFANSYPWGEVAFKCADGINTALEHINWETVQSGFMAFCQGIGKNVNTFMTKISFSDIMHTFLMGIDTAFKGIQSFIDEIHPLEIAQNIVDGLNTAIRDFSANAKEWGETAGQLIHSLCLVIKKVIADTNWGEVLSSVGDFMAGIDWGEVMSTVFEVIAGLWTFKNIFKSVLWESIVLGIANSIKDRFVDDLDIIAGIGEDIIDGLLQGLEDGWQGICDFFQGIIDWVKGIFGIHSPSTVFAEMGDFMVQGLGQGFSDGWSGFTETISGLWDGLKEGLSGTWESIKETAGTAWEGVKTSVTDKFDTAKETLTDVAGTIHDNVSEKWEEIQKASSDVWEDVKSTVSDRIGEAENAATKVSDTLKKNVSESWDKLKTNTGTAYEGIKSGVEEKFSTMKDTVEGFAGNLHDKVSGKWQEMTNNATDKWQEIQNNVTDKFSAARDTVQGTAGDILSKIGNKWQEVANDATNKWEEVKGNITGKMESTRTDLNGMDFLSIGKNIVGGLQSGIENNWTAFTNKVSTLCDGFIKGVKNIFGIHSPSTVFAEIGGYTMEGFQEGIESAYRDVETSIEQMADNIMYSFTSSQEGGINSDKWADQAKEIVNGFKDKITSSFRTIMTPMISWATSVREWFTDSSYGGVNRNTWSNYAQQIIFAFKDTITQRYTDTKAIMVTWATSVREWFISPNGTSLVTSFYQIGRNIIQGFIDGVNSLWYTAMQRIREFGEQVIAQGRAATQEASPSKAFRQIGAYVVEGFNLGIDDEMQSTLSKVSEWLDTINESMVVTPRFEVDTSSLRNYTPNYGTDFAATSFNARQQYIVGGAIKADIDITGQMTEALDRVVASRLDSIMTDTRRCADKPQETIVKIGNRVITDEVSRQTAANGFNFTPSYV